MNAKDILNQVYTSLQEGGYDAVRQLRDYLISGDPAYIADVNGARALICSVEREQLLCALLDTYFGA